ncbi:MAG: RagB/SusD family nutrient uptake outer membrane protein [Rikenellaceae bacterium]
MKKIFTILSVALLVLGSCSKDYLDTTPTDSVSGQLIFNNTESAMVALNGIYGALYLPNSTWFGTTGNVQQNFGIVSHNMVADLMGEDFVQAEQGNGWFYYDYKYDVRSRYASASWRCYGLWNFYYKIITNANYILASKDVITGDPNEIKSIVGQALALRAYSYFYLAQFFQQTYVGNEDKPGVPLYTEPTLVGAPRGTLREVYTQIDSDLAEATALLQEAKTAGIARAHKSQIDYNVAKAIQAKVFLVEEKWADAATAAAAARSGYALLSGDALYSGFNDIALSSVIWGGQVIATEAISGGWGSFFCHIDAGSTPSVISANGYGVSSRKCIDTWLYNQISSTDKRIQWWKGVVSPQASSGPQKSYVQQKYKYKNITDYTGDYIYLRAEEMLLIEAEAKAHLSQFAAARTLLMELGAVRDPNMATRLAARTDAATYNSDTHGAFTTIMDEILFQRRIELWCEAGRLFDLKRLKLGFTRSYTGTNHSQLLLTKVTTVGSKEFVLPIPQQEFDGNENMDIATDQNPL